MGARRLGARWRTPGQLRGARSLCGKLLWHGVGGAEWHGAAGELRGAPGKIWFPLIGKEYLLNSVVRLVGGEGGGRMAGVVAEALLTKAARQGAAFK